VGPRAAGLHVAVNREIPALTGNRIQEKDELIHPYLGSGAHPASYPMGTGGSFRGGKVAGGEADHSPPLVPRSRMHGAIPPLPQYVFMAWCLLKHRDNFTFIFTFTFTFRQ
jgi:hypothetical protein